MSRHDDHMAAALVYEPGSGAPVVTASARGELVQKMLEIAEQYNVPVMKNPVLAEALSGMNPGTSVPENLFAAAAEVFVFCARTDGKLRKKLDFKG